MSKYGMTTLQDLYDAIEVIKYSEYEDKPDKFVADLATILAGYLEEYSEGYK